MHSIHNADFDKFFWIVILQAFPKNWFAMGILKQKAMGILKQKAIGILKQKAINLDKIVYSAMKYIVDISC